MRSVQLISMMSWSKEIALYLKVSRNLSKGPTYLLSLVMIGGLMLQFPVYRFRRRTFEVARQPAQRYAQNVAMMKFAPHSLAEPEPQMMQAFHILRP